ncbi:MAG: HAMP domain-containing protein, partial [Candidatus Omnitrophica bacterium]|nr:HAMP domain-containing protein [Candidatus Omnitrophota bacterium]
MSKYILESYVLKKEKDIEDLDSLIDTIGKKLNLRVTFIASDGKVLGDGELPKDILSSLDNHLDRPEVQEALKKGLGFSKRFSKTLKQNLLYMAVPVQNDKITGFLRLAVPLQNIRLVETGLRKIIILALVFVLLFSFILLFFTSLSISRPLFEITKIAQAYAYGDFSKKPFVYFHDEIGQLAKTLGIMADQIKTKIQQIQQETAKLNTVLASMFEGIMVTDEKGEILLVNPSLKKLLSLEKEPQGKKPIEVMRYITIQNIVDEIIEGKKNLVSDEIVVNLPQEMVLKINGAPIIRESKLEGVVLVFHDITRMRQLEKIRQDFVANVSHELRTPISNIKGYAETLLEGAIDDKDNLK